MSYQVLARKWRPQRFSEVVGQQHVLSALENGLRENRLHHAYLFSGTRGVGKTSIARLFAKGLNCETGITPTPCGQCANCKAIEEGRFIDLIEIDAASRTKVEDTRELLDNVQYKPTIGRFKVYLIDEVHMLSRHSFNALLKTLEEPPEYVKFLLATTDPQKLPITILSRCMQFHLRALDQSQISQHLEFILNQEKIPYELSAIEKLAKSAQGSIRDALSLTDQAIAVSNANITLPIVSQMLGLIDDHEPLDLVQALALADGEKMMAVIERIATKGIDWQQFLNDLAEVLHQIAILQLLPHSHTQESQIHFLAKQIPPEDVQLFYQIVLTGKKELPFAPDFRAGVEMTLLRALAFHPKRVIESPVPMQAQPPKIAPISSKIEQVRQQLEPSTAKQAVSSEPSFAKNTPSEEALAKTNPPEAPQQAVNSEQSFANSDSAPPTLSPALQAMQARQQLRQKAEQSEKKKSELKPELTRPKVKNEPQDLHQRLMNMAESKSQSKPSQEQKAPLATSDEDYRWTWLNPELEQESQSTKPSDIKQAILQERTPELVKKTIELACEQDSWSRLVASLQLGGLSRQIALNSYLAEQQNNHLSLVLKPAMAHLDTEQSRQALNEALASKGLTYSLTQGESNQHQTPLELRRAIFEGLTKEAKEALLADEKLNLLRQAFEAEIDESTIRAVA